MVDRYITVINVQDALELGTLSTTTSPKKAVVEGWITAAESELDTLTSNKWDIHTVTDELLNVVAQTNIFYASKIPVNSITSIYLNAGTEWDEDWSLIDSANYKLDNDATGKIKTKVYYWKENSLKITYSAGYTTIPEQVKELCLALVEKRYIDNQLAQSATDNDVVSVATIRIADKTKENASYRLTGLQSEIDNKVRNLGRAMKAKNYNIGYIDLSYPQIKRYRFD